MANITAPETSTNDIIDLTNERVDNLAALITVSAEQLDDRNTAEEALDTESHRTNELISLVFGSNVPSVENYLASREQLVAA